MYFVDSLILKYLCNRRSDSWGIFSIGCSSQFLDSKTNGEYPVRLGCIVLMKSAWKSVYGITEFTVGSGQLYILIPYPPVAHQVNSTSYAWWMSSSKALYNTLLWLLIFRRRVIMFLYLFYSLSPDCSLSEHNNYLATRSKATDESTNRATCRIILRLATRGIPGTGGIQPHPDHNVCSLWVPHKKITRKFQWILVHFYFSLYNDISLVGFSAQLFQHILCLSSSSSPRILSSC